MMIKATPQIKCAPTWYGDKGNSPAQTMFAPTWYGDKGNSPDYVCTYLIWW